MCRRKLLLITVAMWNVATAPFVSADTIQKPISGFLRAPYQSGKSISIPRFEGSGTLRSVTLAFQPEFSGTVAGTANGPFNAPNGWVTEFSGTIRLAVPVFGNLDVGHFETRSGTVYQPGTQIFQSFGPQDLQIGPTTITSGLSTFAGTGNVIATLSWPVFNGYIFFSNGGSQGPVTRDLGAVGGTVTYEFDPLPCPGDLNNDRTIDMSDLTALLTEYGCTGTCSSDLNHDGITDLADLAILLSVYGTNCP